ncbi:Mov34/MPN/PAD-1 family protein [Acidovorax sp. Root219]|uniref:Mov34/MPN/PAD-1 family protein n=1 Tax=Acidovorax sp. Root219 TaxID=1736493 RepID=UPI0009EA463A
MVSPKLDASCRLAGAGWVLTFSEASLQLIGSHAQTHHSSKESVGQLYCRDLTLTNIVIEHATVLPKSRAGFTSVDFNPDVAAKERTQLFERGLHCVGLWHSHPEPSPRPSPTDALLAADYARAASTHLKALLFAIVGTRPVPEGLSVWFHDGSQFLPAIWEC